MNLGEIRRRILEQVDWNPDQSTLFLGKVDRLINRAYQQLSLEAPFLFFEDECRILTQPDASHGVNTSDRLAPATVAEVGENDKLILFRKYTGTIPSDYTRWAFDSTWDGRMIEVERSDGVVLRRRAREFWKTVTTDQPIITTEYLSLDHQWPNLTDTDLKYRIYTPEYELPADVVELRTARFWNDVRSDISVVNQYDMERHEYTDYRGQEVGRPTMLFRGKHHQIDAPVDKPKVSVMRANSGAWTGPDNIGTFQYCYTYVWGKREPDLKAPGGKFEPKWESAPSPVSDLAVMSPTTPYNQIVQIGLPNIDHMLLFGQTMSGYALAIDRLRTGHSGYFKRIYVRRVEIPILAPNSTGASESSDNQGDSPFFLLTEVNGDAITYDHIGDPVPDYYRRLKEVHGYQTIRFHPMPDGNYEIDCRVLRRPQQLIVDTDAPRIHEEATEILIQLSVSFLYELQGILDTAVLANERAMNLLKLITKRYGALPTMRQRKRPARVRAPYREVRVKFTEN